jgi:hypothetical protein
MKTAGALLLVLGVLTVTPPAVRAQCTLFSTDAKCQPSREPRLNFDFSGRPNPVDGDRIPWLSPKPFIFVPRAAPPDEPVQPMDCTMIRQVDPSLDRRIARTPPAADASSRRVIRVPSCSAN